MKNSNETCRRGNSSDFTVHIIKNTEELQQHIFEKKQIWDRKVKNREYSKGKF